MSPQDPGDHRVIAFGVILLLGLLVAFWLTVQAMFATTP